MYEINALFRNGAICWDDPLDGFRAKLDAAKTRIAYGVGPADSEGELYAIAAVIFGAEYKPKDHENCSNNRAKFSCYMWPKQ